MEKPQCRFFAKGYCRNIYNCRFQHDDFGKFAIKKTYPVKFAKRVKSCRHGEKCKNVGKCKFTHPPKLPTDIWKLILERDGLFLNEIKLTCKSWYKIITELFPMKIYLFTRVMNGCYTPGTASAVARSKYEAIYNVARSSIDPVNHIRSHCGTWSRHDAERSWNSKFFLDIKQILKKQAIDNDFNNFCLKLYKNYISGDYDDFMVACDIYVELDEAKPHIIPMNKQFGFYCGGGS
jgi:hypothetical protein